MGRVGTAKRLDPAALQKINVFVQAAMDKATKGKDSAKIDEAKLVKQVKADVTKQIAPYLKQGVDDSTKSLIDKTVDKTIAASWSTLRNKAV
jgi:hypothetical protein